MAAKRYKLAMLLRGSLPKGNLNTNLLGGLRVGALGAFAISRPGLGALVGDFGSASTGSAGLLNIFNTLAST
jgi:hypothetical protein